MKNSKYNLDMIDFGNKKVKLQLYKRNNFWMAAGQHAACRQQGCTCAL
jgi:hypothetical protein